MVPVVVPVVVTRHPALVEYLEERGIIPAGITPIIHCTRRDVEGKHVVGVLPNYLACHAKSLTEVPMDIPAALRGAELSLEQIKSLAMPVARYTVTKILSWSEEGNL
jgi:hypothetical protein